MKKMTKLQEWIFGLSVYAIVYFLVLGDALPVKICQKTKFYVQLSPIVLIGLFGQRVQRITYHWGLVYSVVVILYRVATFNDCNEAAIELKQQIEEARKDLKSKGFKFD